MTEFLQQLTAATPTLLLEPMSTWAGHAADYPSNKTVAQIFEEVAHAHPDRIALIHDGQGITYVELNRRANRLAHRLCSLGVTDETLVGVCLDRSADLIVAFLGVLKAGGAYVPFDPAYPRERLDFLLSDTSVWVMVTQSSLAEIAWPNRHDNVILLDKEAAATSSVNAENLTGTGSPRSLAYVMYTSGSTGRPKGVLIENRAIVRLVFNNNYCHFGPDEVFLQAAPCSFDASTFEIWGALLHGATLVIPFAKTLSLVDLGAAIREHRVTTLWLTSGLFNLFVDERIEDLQPVRQLLAGGDVLSARHVRRVLEYLPDTTIINGYGPTENTTFTCCHVTRPGGEVLDTVPIGKPIHNTRVYILDQAGDPVGIGERGELYAGGDGVARGYLNAPEASAERFVPDPFGASPDARMYRTGDMVRWRVDGTIDFLGRLDDQVKILGHRIELGEVEAAMVRHPQVHQACALVIVDEREAKRLVACFVPAPGAKVVEEDLKDFLSAMLPNYLLPASYRAVQSLPLNPNGKVDRAVLASFWDAPTRVIEEAPKDDCEDIVAKVWSDVLGETGLDVDENFFDVGGDSLLLMAVHSRLQKLLQVNIDLVDLFEFTTIRTLAEHLSKSASTSATKI